MYSMNNICVMSRLIAKGIQLADTFVYDDIRLLNSVSSYNCLFSIFSFLTLLHSLFCRVWPFSHNLYKSYFHFHFIAMSLLFLWLIHQTSFVNLCLSVYSQLHNVSTVLACHYAHLCILVEHKSLEQLFAWWFSTKTLWINVFFNDCLWEFACKFRTHRKGCMF